MRATAIAQPNIALIKYWGKRDARRNLPAVGSISITLSQLQTEMQVQLDPDAAVDALQINGANSAEHLPRVSRCLDAVAGGDRPAATVQSRNNYPMAAGLASSAAAFAALTVAAAEAAGIDLQPLQLARLAGAASGSAARSLFGGFVELTNVADGIDVVPLLNAQDWPLNVVIAVTERGTKPVGSSEAMEISRATSPFYERWLAEQDDDLAAARSAIGARDFAALGEIAEHNCLKMHSVMWTSRPSIVYWNAATLDCMRTVRNLRRDGCAVFFTIDAGPQVKAVCLPEHRQAVVEALQNVAGVVDVLQTGLGEGARLQEPA